MAPKNPSRPPQDVNTATISTIRPGTPVVPLNPAEHEALAETARQQGVNTAEAMRKIAERLPQAPPRQSVTEESLDKIDRIRELANDDPGDPLNQMMRYGLFKDIKKEMKRGDEDKMSPRDMMEMNMVNMQLLIMQRSMGGETQGGGATQQLITEMKSENEKQRQYYEQKLKEQDEKIRDMIFEKRIQTIEETHAETMSGVSNQLAELGQRLELYRNIPTNPSPEQQKDAISHLEDIGGQIDRIKKALAPFGIIPSSPSSPLSSLPAAPGQDTYKKSDGTVDYFRYSVDKLENTIGKITDAWQKKTPERKLIAETPPPETRQPQQKEATYRQLSPEEYADVILSKQNPTHEEQQWLNNYSAYIERQQAKIRPQKKTQYIPPEPQPREQAIEPQQPTGCSICGNPEIYQDGLCQTCWTNQNAAHEQAAYQEPQPKKGMLERLREQEEADLRRNAGLL